MAGKLLDPVDNKFHRSKSNPSLANRKDASMELELNNLILELLTYQSDILDQFVSNI